MALMQKKRLGDILVMAEKITPSQLQSALKTQKIWVKSWEKF